MYAGRRPAGEPDGMRAHIDRLAVSWWTALDAGEQAVRAAGP
jgi:hypothetical protein